MILKIKILVVKSLIRIPAIANKIEEIKISLNNSHVIEIEELKNSHVIEIEELKNSHVNEIEELNNSHVIEIEELNNSHVIEIENIISINRNRKDPLLSALHPVFDTKITFLKKQESNDLEKLCEKYGTDKGYTTLGNHPYGWTPHNYAIYYGQIFEKVRFDNINIFECGIGTNNPDIPSNMTMNGIPGASLRVWQEYFPNANIFGADIDETILFNDIRIKTGFLNQLNLDSIDQYFGKIGEIEFDIMIDDGLHTFESSINLFKKTIKYLKPTGIYIVEDVFPENFKHFRDFFSDLDYFVDYVVLENWDRNSIHDNGILQIRKLKD